MEDDVDIRERDFHNAVREYIIWLLIFILLYVSSYATIIAYRKKTDTEEYYSGDQEDAVVYRISLWICTFTLAVSGGAVLLLPMSIVLNESLVIFPKSYYLQWVNDRLVHGLWNIIFLCSNLALFVLMPFAYLFTESEGFPGSRKGVMSRVYETLAVLFLMTILVCGIAWIASALINEDKSSRKTLFDVWNFYLPFLYSCISLLGVLMLLMCTPVGFARLFTVIGELVIKPRFLRDLDEELHTVRFEEENLKRKLQYQSGDTLMPNGHSDSPKDIKSKLDEIQGDRKEIEKRLQVSSLRRNLGYPIVMILLLILTAISVLLVTQNTLELLTGIKNLPVGTKDLVLGIASFSALGSVGALVEIIIILYLMLASVVGFYSLPVFCHLKPKLHDTTMTKLIGNCIVILVLSSALPVLSRALGITNFDLLGDFGRMEWLGNLYIILTYNVIFAVATALCLTNKFTAALRRELFERFRMAFRQNKDRDRDRTISDRSMSISFTSNGNGFHLKDE